MNNIFQDLIYSYDDFGDFALRRKMNSPVISETFTYDNINTTFDRGFCMHEHYRDFGLINMNGRMYDPYTSMSYVLKDHHFAGISTGAGGYG